MMAIATKAKVAIILGVSESDVVDGYLTIADNYVKLLLNRTFDGITSAEHYIDTRARNDYYESYYDGVRDFVMPNFPVTEITSVLLNPDSDSPTTLTEDTEYFVNLGSGFITLADNFFPEQGQRRLKVNYKYGYSTAPDDVIDFASYYAAFLQESRTSIAKNNDGSILKEVEIGRYREQYATASTALKMKYTDFLTQMEGLIVQKYKVWE